MVKIQTEGTPNPNALKFVLDKELVSKGTFNFTGKETCANSPLALRLFNITSIKEILIAKNFITVSKDPYTDWNELYDKVIETINKHFDSGEVAISKIEELDVKSENNSENDSANNIEQKIKDILDSQIRPAVASDGGDIIFDSYQDGILRLHLQGACSSCPSSIMTLKSGIEAMLKRQIPELKEVISV